MIGPVRQAKSFGRVSAWFLLGKSIQPHGALLAGEADVAPATYEMKL